MKQLNIRNMISSSPIFNNMPVANWSSWTIRKSVKEGYEASGWVYRAISIISRAAASVPWLVYDQEGKPIPEHYLSKVFKRPNPALSRQDVFELIVAWLELGGESYIKKVYGTGMQTKEIWPICPDRIAPVPSKEFDQIIASYEIIAENGSKQKTNDYTIENMIQLKLIDPSDPIRGISPLKAAAKAVDIDNDQKSWNKSAMQNRGVLDGVFTFDRDIDESTFQLLKRMIKERFGGSKRAREPGIIGSAAKYQQMSLSPVEMDFLASRKFNREEIFIIFGIPLPLAGVGDNMTYNNYSESNKIFWESTIIPLLDDIADSLNHSFANELGDNYSIGYDAGNIEALRDNEEKKSKVAKTYFDMGVPVSVLNKYLDLGIDEYDGWDKSYVKTNNNSGINIDGSQNLDGDVGKKSDGRSALKLEKRNVEKEFELKDKIGSGIAHELFSELLDIQREDVFEALDNEGDIETAVKKSHDIWVDKMNKLAIETAKLFYKTINVENRAAETNENIVDSITRLLESQASILIEKSAIDEFTVSKIIDIVKNSVIEGGTVESIKQSILDSGIFSSERALRIARTETATASSIGQMASAINVGATHKVWHTSGFEVREAHVHRSGERRRIDEPFSVQVGNVGPMYPGDPNIAAADRINCRCSMSFEIA